MKKCVEFSVVCKNLGAVFDSRHCDATLQPLHSPVYCKYFSLSALSLGIGEVGHRELNIFNIKAVMFYKIKLYTKLVHVTMAKHFLMMQMEERPSLWRVAANSLIKYCCRADNAFVL